MHDSGSMAPASIGPDLAIEPHDMALPDRATVLVASDMHLGDHDPETGRFFLDALRRAQPGHSHLILLGDLFEAWPGDDQSDPVATELVAHLATLNATGISVYVMRGNRDFLIDVPVPNHEGPTFAANCGAHVLPDPTCLRLANQQFLLMHGDSLCIDDTDYQAFRRQCRQPAWQQAFLGHELSQRVAQAKAYRAASKETHRNRPPAQNNITDVNQQAVDSLLTSCQCRTLVHGHTHRPDIHRWTFLDEARERYVLPDWDAKNKRGGFLRLSAGGLSQVDIRD